MIAMVRDGFNGSEPPLCHGAAADGVGKGEYPFLNLGREPKHAKNLCHPSTVMLSWQARAA